MIAMISSSVLNNIRSTTPATVDLHRILSITELYDHGKTNIRTSLDDHDDDHHNGGHRLDPRPPPPPPPPPADRLAAAGFVFKWYALIAILSVLVLTGIAFAVFRLSLKAEAFRKSGLDTHQDGLLFAVEGGGGGGGGEQFCLPMDRDADDGNEL